MAQSEPPRATYGATHAPQSSTEPVEPAASSAVSTRRIATFAGALTALALVVAQRRGFRSRTPGRAILRKYVDDDEMVGDDYVHKNWPGLICNRDDDDYYDWGAADSVMACVKGDSYTCATWNSSLTQCASTCNGTDVKTIKRAEAEYGSSWNEHAQMVGHSWEVVCAWEAIANLPEVRRRNSSHESAPRENTPSPLPFLPSSSKPHREANTTTAHHHRAQYCDDTFEPYLPTAQSKNLEPSHTTTSAANLQLNGSWPSNPSGEWDACNVHAFCYVCENDDGSLNKYCEAVLQKYSQKNAWNVGTPSQVKTFVTRTKDSFWCTSDVINAIENSTFLALIQPGEALASGGWI